MLRSVVDLDDRPAQEELLRREAGDDVLHRQLELLDRERAGVVQADERAAAANELLERRADRPASADTRTRAARPPGAPPAAASAAGRARDRQPRIIGKISTSTFSRAALEILRMHASRTRNRTARAPSASSPRPCCRSTAGTGRCAVLASRGPAADACARPASASDFTSSSCAAPAGRRSRSVAGRSASCDAGALLPRAIDRRKALFSAGSTTSAAPVPVSGPAGGTIAAAAGSASKPTPGTLSNGAASVFSAASYGVGFTFGSGSGPSELHLARASRRSAARRRHDAHAHLQRQRPAGGVVRALRRTAGILAQIGIRCTSSTSRAIAANS